MRPIARIGRACWAMVTWRAHCKAGELHFLHRAHHVELHTDHMRLDCPHGLCQVLLKPSLPLGQRCARGCTDALIAMLGLNGRDGAAGPIAESQSRVVAAAAAADPSGLSLARRRSSSHLAQQAWASPPSTTSPSGAPGLPACRCCVLNTTGTCSQAAGCQLQMHASQLMPARRLPSGAVRSPSSSRWQPRASSSMCSPWVRRWGNG